MEDDQDFQARMARVEALIRQLERTSDPAVRASIKELMQAVMDLHGTAVNRMLEIMHESGEPGARIIDSVGDDPLAGSLLILYGLHPQDTATRVVRAMEKLAPMFRRYGADVELEGVEESIVRLRIAPVESASVGRTLKTAIEEQIYALAPDVTRIEGLASLGASDLVAIQTLTAAREPVGVAIGKGGD